VIVHFLFEGRALCGMSPSIPALWPKDHRWARVEEPLEVNCPGCIAARKVKILGSQFGAGGKRCGCGARYDAESWKALPLGYVNRDAYATQEARHCRCGSTLVILTAIHDLGAE
jgi:hypothetical protein